MSRQRTINDQIWRSNRLSGCTVEDRYALFYFLTSPFSNVIGAYEIVIRVAASEMGWDPDSQLMPVMRRLIDAGILDFDPQANYIWIKDWWDHNSAKMAVATTLRKKTLEQIAALPQGWRDAYVNDFIDRLPTEDPLRNTVAKALGYGPYRLSTPYAGPDDGRTSIPAEAKDIHRNQSISNGHTPATAYLQGMGRGPGNTTTNTNPIYNPTTTTRTDNDLQYPTALVPAEKLSIQNLLTDVQSADAQALLDELDGAIKTPGTIRKTKVAYFKGILERHRTGGFVPSAGIPIATRRERLAATQDMSRASESAPLSKAASQARLQEIKAQLELHTRMPK
ncbi:hypothetical protein [Bordetella bronchiseptica]|uniref:hypothetical protein n=1 Tax=Bordetella bronchiseptica TaxID=518 RepID=UPI000444B1D7|nr:hypothetical protein [Bordetella bronchiseptica]AWP83028.1 hypothetical protein B7P00_02510 [Bordetella bronchiseptica]AWQ08596.1 hypothetical protein B9G72_02505 [Bordetella bronchiseptica]WLS58567.1 hypothetical protein RAK14_21740 [Bordetella bronchiseptica]WLS63401.1 hypothetical protein RAK11_21755 [Bordetella bronchiseptica]BAO67215.1 hypothetical protein BBS798_0489 [Bordetella bronchiseptica]